VRGRYIAVQYLTAILQRNITWQVDRGQQASSASGALFDLHTGARFWIALRETIAGDTDTVATGPTTAGDWLKKLGD
jgi:hypothetical protein